ncbi:MAG: DICT sensory domain-containing protein [Verrucomicrobiia bacterium]
MIVATRDEAQTRRKFSKLLKPYLTDCNPKACQVRPADANARMVTLGEMVSIPRSDLTHVFNNEAMLAISHAIEDLAAEVREGELISTFQSLDNFTPQKRRYLGLARDLDAVRVWGSGSPPKRCGKIDFVPIFRPELTKYWLVLFASDQASAVLVCRQINQASTFDKKLFAGFYSFNPFLVQSIRRQFNLMSCGLDTVVRQLEKELNIPTLSLSELSNYFETLPQHR